MNRLRRLALAGDTNDTDTHTTHDDGYVVPREVPEPLPYEPCPSQPPIGSPELVFVYR